MLFIFSFFFASYHRRRRIESLMDDTEEMMDTILPLCQLRPSVYYHLSDKLAKWILEIDEEVNDDAIKELKMMSSFDDDDDSDDSNNNNHRPAVMKRNYSDGCIASIINTNSESSNNDDELFSVKHRKKKRQFSDSCLHDTTNSSHRERFALTKEQMNFQKSPTALSSNTYDEIKNDLQFLKQDLYRKSSSHRIRRTISALIRQLASNIVVYEAIRRNKEKRFEKEWNSERNQLLEILNTLDERSNTGKWAEKSNPWFATMWSKLGHQKKNNNDDYCYPHARVYNQVLTRYLSHIRVLPPFDYCNDGTKINECYQYRWKRPERLTSSQIHRNDVRVLNEFINTIPTDDDDNSKLVASQRILNFLQRIRESCHKEAEALSKLEVQLAQNQQKKHQRAVEMRKFKKRNRRVRMSFALLSPESKRRLLGTSME